MLAVRLLVLVTRGWLWWRHVDALGIAATFSEEHLDLLETVSDREDYFAIFEDG